MASLKKIELIRLVKKVLDGKATTEEIHFVKKYYDFFDKEEYGSPRLSRDEKMRLEEQLFKKINDELDAHENKKIGPPRKYFFFKIAAAFFFLISLAAIGWYQYQRSPGEKISAYQAHAAWKDIHPGSNKAILTLSNGSKVILDSMAAGQITSQGQYKILKLQKGLLTYDRQNDTGRNHLNNHLATLDMQYNTLSIPRGGKYKVRLSDGTNVWLNAASSLTYPIAFTGKERCVTLTGEAYFEVQQNADKPFKVKVGKMEVMVLGTHFNIMAYDDEPAARTTLLEGSVKIATQHNSMMLKPGQQAVIRSSMPERIKVKAVDGEEAIAWKNGFFAFHRTNIYEIMRQISRWYDVNVNFQDSLHVFLNGSITRDANVSEVFKMLKLTGELDFTIKGKEIIVRKKK